MRLNRRNFINGSAATIIYRKASRRLLEFLLKRQDWQS